MRKQTTIVVTGPLRVKGSGYTWYKFDFLPFYKGHKVCTSCFIYPSEIGSTLNEKNLLPLRANSFLLK